MCIHKVKRIVNMDLKTGYAEMVCSDCGHSFGIVPASFSATLTSIEQMRRSKKLCHSQLKNVNDATVKPILKQMLGENI